MENMFTLTEECISNAISYVPSKTKRVFIDLAISECLEKYSIKVDDEVMPPLVHENTEMKSRYLMTALVGLYLGIDYESVSDDDALMTEEEYDRFAGSHIFNQIERMKKCNSAEVKDKCFDIMHDYKDLEKRLNTEIYGKIQAQNDWCARYTMMTNQSMSPDMVKNALESIEQIRNEYDKYYESRARAKEIQ